MIRSVFFYWSSIDIYMEFYLISSKFSLKYIDAFILCYILLLYLFALLILNVENLL